MRQCLTSPDGGYYTTKREGRDQFGRKGDFVTSPEISQIFGELFGLWLLTEWMVQGRKKHGVEIIEVGPGRGTLMDDILGTVSTFKSLASSIENIYLVEASPALRAAQKDLLCGDAAFENVAAGYRSISKYAALPVTWCEDIRFVPNEPDKTPFVFAHEFFDALPIHAFQSVPPSQAATQTLSTPTGQISLNRNKGEAQKPQWRELLVSPTVPSSIITTSASSLPSAKPKQTKADFQLSLAKASNPSSLLLPAQSQRYKDLLPTTDAVIEISPESHSYVAEFARRIGGSKNPGTTTSSAVSPAPRKPEPSGAALILDYGPAETIPSSTLRGIRSHQLVSPFADAGEVDLSADVDFIALVEAALGASEKVEVHGPVEQGVFLEQMGIKERSEMLIRGLEKSGGKGTEAAGDSDQTRGNDAVDMESRKKAIREAVERLMLSSGDDCDECRPGGRRLAITAVFFSCLPFLATFLLVSTIVLKKIYPVLSAHASSSSKSSSSSIPPSRLNVQSINAITFSTTLALAAVLAELILCEISNTIDPYARRLAFQFTVSLLLLVLVIVIPSLQIQSVISAAGWEFTNKSKGGLRIAWALQSFTTAVWLVTFWWVGNQLLSRTSTASPATENEGQAQSLSEACLSRVGILGISLLGLLSGFASVSAAWQNIFAKHRPVTESDVARKAAGLESTKDMLATKHSRLRALERKMSDVAQDSNFFQKAMGSIRGSTNHTEIRSLGVEIRGLEAMASSLSTSHNMLQTQLQQQNRNRTLTGRSALISSYLFSLFCIYRILTAFYSTLRRSVHSSQLPSTSPTTPSQDQLPTSSTSSDLITTLLALIATHYNPHLDRDLYTRQLSFLLSGLILLASFNSVMQTFSLIARFLPSLLRAVNQNLPLLVAQVCGMYTISAALMLRGRVPGQVVGEGLKEMGGGQSQSGWVDGWFDGWFLGGVGVTIVGIWLGRKIGGAGEWDDVDWYVNEDVEMGKRS
ncbi:MAG: hypothetical protein Q9168_006782 [Polycauliona sp. 1 TL-2023]